MGGRTESLAERALPKIDFTAGDCWEWIGSRNRAGYGVMRGANYVEEPQRRAHRVVYELLVGPIPEDRELDHLCRNRACVNPAHLEAVSHRVNIHRSPVAPTAINAAKTHCNQGHPFDAENTRINTNGSRSCRTCDRDRARRRYQERVR